MTNRTGIHIVIAAAGVLFFGVAAAAVAAEGSTSCSNVPEPVVKLDFGSRYTDESADRSDLDEQSNAEVNEALAPIDDFIETLADASNAAVAGEEDAKLIANCVVDAIHSWAEADALSKLDSDNAHLAVPSRVAGFAFAYAQVKDVADNLDGDTRRSIETWLRKRVDATIYFFDRKAPANASRNNLRAWAALSAAAVGKITENDRLKSWAAYSAARVSCQADKDGALPLEMDRGPRALHYQLHAVAPLVMTGALLDADGYPVFDTCDRSIHRAVDFVVRAFDDESLATQKAGEAQTYFSGDEDLEGFELAWAFVYLKLFENSDLADFVESFEPLSNSKLGGRQDVIW